MLHEASCFHRDIAPDNILILHDGSPLLLDFGAARHVIGESTQQLTAILKPAFAPIEQYAEATHLQQGPWTDIYALGAVARFCITGNSPTPSTVRALHDEMESLTNEVRTLAREYPGLHYSAPFLAALDWALAVRPADRPQNVHQFREALNKPYVTPSVRAAAPPLPEEPATPAQPPTEAIPAPAQTEVEAQMSEEERAEAAVKRLLESVDGPPADHAPMMVDEPWIASRPAELKYERKPERSRLRQAVLFGLAATAVGAIGAATWLWKEDRQRASEAIAAAALPPSGATPDVVSAPPAPAALPGTPAAPAMPAPPVATTQPAPVAQTAPPTPPVVVSPPAERVQPTLVTPPAAPAPTTSVAQPTATAATTSVAQPAPPAATTSVAQPAAPAQPTSVAPPAAPAQATTSPATASTQAPKAPVPPATSRVADAGSARATARARPSAPAEPDNPRAVCGSRQQFALYYCMQTQCQNTRFYAHPQCVDLRRRDEVD